MGDSVGKSRTLVGTAAVHPHQGIARDLVISLRREGHTVIIG